jgi:hypothetical protein
MKDPSTDQPEVLGMRIQFIIVRICCSLVYVIQILRSYCSFKLNDIHIIHIIYRQEKDINM